MLSRETRQGTKMPRLLVQSSLLEARWSPCSFIFLSLFGMWFVPFHCCLCSNNTTCQPQAACGLPRELVVNIDATDTDNELAAAEYIDDIYEFYKNTEVMFYDFSLFISPSSLMCCYNNISDSDEAERWLCA